MRKIIIKITMLAFTTNFINNKYIYNFKIVHAMHYLFNVFLQWLLTVLSVVHRVIIKIILRLRESFGGERRRDVNHKGRPVGGCSIRIFNKMCCVPRNCRQSCGAPIVVNYKLIILSINEL